MQTKTLSREKHYIEAYKLYEHIAQHSPSAREREKALRIGSVIRQVLQTIMLEKYHAS